MKFLMWNKVTLTFELANLYPPLWNPIQLYLISTSLPALSIMCRSSLFGQKHQVPGNFNFNIMVVTMCINVNFMVISYLYYFLHTLQRSLDLILQT